MNLKKNGQEKNSNCVFFEEKLDLLQKWFIDFNNIQFS